MEVSFLHFGVYFVMDRVGREKKSFAKHFSKSRESALTKHIYLLYSIDIYILFYNYIFDDYLVCNFHLPSHLLNFYFTFNYKTEIVFIKFVFYQDTFKKFKFKLQISSFFKDVDNDHHEMTYYIYLTLVANLHIYTL